MSADRRERIHDLLIEELDDGTIRLEQSAGCGETVIVDLHPIQIRHLAERAGLLEQSGTLVPTARPAAPEAPAAAAPGQAALFGEASS